MYVALILNYKLIPIGNTTQQRGTNGVSKDTNQLSKV